MESLESTSMLRERRKIKLGFQIEQHTMQLKSMAPAMLLSVAAIAGGTPASVLLAPKLALRYGLASQ